MSTLALRPVEPGDEGFLHRVYAAARADEIAPFGWSEAQRDAFMMMQSTLQRRSWEAQFPRVDRAVVLVDGAPAGRMYVDRSGASLQLVDIALLPEHRGAGVGGRLIRALLTEADRTGKPVCLHVARDNRRARRLYERLGFVVTQRSEIYDAMERPPAAASKTS